MNIRYRKVWRDLLTNKGRTLLVVLSISVGVTAIGMIFSMNKLLNQQMSAAQIASHPSHVKLYLDSQIDEETLHSLERLPEISQMEGSSEFSVNWKRMIEDEWEQKKALVIARDDYKNQSFDLITLLSGQWPDLKSVDVEFNHVVPFNVPPIGEPIYFEVNERPFELTVAGAVHDPSQFPPPNAQNPTFYVTRDIMERLSGSRDFNVLRFTIPEFSKDAAEQAVETVKNRLRNLGISVTYYEIQEPDRHPLQDIINGVGLVLSVMAIMSLFLSVLLVINTVSAVIAQQIPQIGVMKTIGGERGDITRLYLAGVGVYGLLSLAIAVPLGTLGGYALAKWLLYLLNVPSAPFSILWVALIFQILAGLLTPLLAALWPVMRGAAISVREAIGSYGLGAGQFGAGLIGSILARIRGLPRLALLPLRNTFRSLGRVVLTELTLVGAGALFLTVLSTGSSVNKTIAQAWQSFGFDIILTFKNPQRISEVVPMIDSFPQVENAEMWIWRSAKAKVPGTSGAGSEHNIALRGFPAGSVFYKPQIVAGEDLESTTDRTLLLNQKLAKDMGLGVGDEISIDLGEDRVALWTIKGLIIDLTSNQETAYMYLNVLNEELNQVDRASVAEIKLKGEENTLEAHLKAISDLQDYFSTQGIDIASTSSSLQEQAAASGQLSILITVLLVMTVLVAIVGSVGLSGTLSINVIERIKEIGVMRAVGASSGDIALIFIGEGLLLGVISWVFAVPISVITAKYFVAALGKLIDVSVRYFYSITGILIWLLIIIVLSLLASWLPAMHATRISVARSLAYE
jgi:putative ABC transport system permease protein